MADTLAITDFEKQTIQKLLALKIPFIVVFNKADIYTLTTEDKKFCEDNKIAYISVSVSDEVSIKSLKELLISQIPQDDMTLFSGMVKENDLIIMVAPIDSEQIRETLLLSPDAIPPANSGTKSPANEESGAIGNITIGSAIPCKVP